MLLIALLVLSLRRVPTLSPVTPLKRSLLKPIATNEVDREEGTPGEVLEEMSVIIINNDTHAGTPMTAHWTLPIQVGEMTTVIAPEAPITPIGVGVMMINHHDKGRALKERDTIAEGTQGFLLMIQKTKALTGTLMMASPTKLPMKTSSCEGFAR